MKIWDISRTLSVDFAEWPGDEPFRYRLTREIAKGQTVNLGAITMSVHNGTHADARFHFDPKGESIEEAPLDIYLGRTGYEAQQYDGLSDPHQPNNLFQPVPGDFGAHGNFDERAHERSPELWIDLHRWLVGLGILGATGIYRLAKGSRTSHRRRRERRAA